MIGLCCHEQLAFQLILGSVRNFMCLLKQIRHH
jgi:hypothetical protein